MSACLIYLYATDMTFLLANFGVADKVPRGGYLDDVLGTEVGDVRFTSVSGCTCQCLLSLVDVSFGLGTIPTC